MFQVRELPPLRQSVLVTTPNGRTYRWGADERRPENVPDGISYSTTMPGGFENFDCSLPRKVGVDFQDMEQLSTITVLGAGGQILWEGRLEKAPRVSGDEVSISPQGVGWQAHLEDDAEAMAVFVDRDLSHWGEASRALKVILYGLGAAVLEDPSTDSDVTTGIPALNTGTTGTGTATSMRCEGWYDAGAGAAIASIYYDMTSQSTVAGDTGQLYTSSDDVLTTTSASADLLTGTNSTATGTFTPSPATYRYGRLVFATSAAGEADHKMMWRRITVWGNTGIGKQGTAPADGVYASDVIAYAVANWAPALRVTADSITSTNFIIPQLEFREPTTVAEIISQANRFSLNDWSVWNGQIPNQPTFYYHPRGVRGKRWRAMVAPAKLQETGPQVDRLFNSSIVTYQDVDGTTKTVGPTGALTDATSNDLLDTDPLNPVNILGLKRPALLDMGIVSTATAATEVGRQFLVRSKELDHSGQAELVGHVTDDHGVVFPASRVRAGDQIAFTDSADSSYRRIVHTNYDHASRTNSLDLDSPPEGMADLLERLGVALTVGTNIPYGSPGAFTAVHTSGGTGGQVTENGPQTKVLQDEMELVREQIRADRHEDNRRLTALETKMQFIIYIGGALFGGLITLVVLVTVGVLNP